MVYPLNLTLRSCKRFTRFHSLASSLSSKAANGSLYNLFGVNGDCTHQELKEAFYRLSKIYHPDVASDPNARAKFLEISQAYEVLGNPSRRVDYDRGLLQPRSAAKQKSSSIYDDDIDDTAIRSAGTDSFSAFYVKHYNRALNEAWFKKSDPEILKTSIEFRQDERNFATVVYAVIGFVIVFGYAYSKWIEQPIAFVSVSEANTPKQQQ